MPQLTEDVVAELKAKHGDRLIAVRSPREMVFKRPPRMVWAEFQDAIAKDRGTRDSAYRKLCFACLVFPEQSDAVEVFDDYPALPTKIGDQLAEMVGLGGDEVEIKKL